MPGAASLEAYLPDYTALIKIEKLNILCCTVMASRTSGTTGMALTLGLLLIALVVISFSLLLFF